jgi:SAM-dependent methyltransferase
MHETDKILPEGDQVPPALPERLVRNEAIVSRVRAYYRATYAPITPRWEKLAGDVLNLDRERERIGRLERALGFALRGRRVLEVGSGFGLFVLAARAAGAQAWGIEPEAPCCDVARLIFEEAGVAPSAVSRAASEALPFRSETFDLVCSFQVLEHTRDPAAALGEALRVVRPGGLLYFVVPNYNSFWESHYGVLWLPRLNRRVGKWLLRRLGRDPEFLDTIQYITPRRLRAMLARTAIPCEAVSWGTDAWRERLVRNDVTAWGQTGLLKKLVGWASTLRLTRPIAWAGERLEFYYPIILVVRRVR